MTSWPGSRDQVANQRVLLAALGLFALPALTGAQRPVPSSDPFTVEAEALVEPARDSGRAVSPDPGHDDVERVSRSRSLERMHWVCETSLNRKDVTLFANGTLRLRKVEGGELAMWLEELPIETLDAYVARLAEPTRAETPDRFDGPQGDWLGTCRLRLELPGRTVEDFRFGARQTLTLDLERTVAIARELEQRFLDRDEPPVGAIGLRFDYEPALGDILRRRDGLRFQVFGFTADGRGIELLGIGDNPLTLYLTREELFAQFESLEDRRPGRR